MYPIETGMAVPGAASALALIALLAPVAAGFDRRFVRGPGGKGSAGRGAAYFIVRAVRLVGNARLRRDLSPMLFAAPLAFAAALMTAAAVSYSPEVSIAGQRFSVTALDPASGVLFSLAMISIWAVASVFSRLGMREGKPLIEALEESSNYLSYFLAMCLSVAAVLMIEGEVNFARIIEAQGHLPWRWNLVRQPLAFAVFSVCACAAIKVPFALGGESAAAAASAINAAARRVLFVALAAMTAALFLGGWQIPFAPVPLVAETLGRLMPGWAVEPSLCALGLLCMIVKTCAAMALFSFARASLPRLREDQFSSFAWRALVPLSMANLVVTAYIAMQLLKGGAWRQ
ncbi:MAG: NADH-quinone oxidoreductase subunit H [bacterium]